MFALDVGCGNKPRGEVNLDYRRELNPEINQRHNEFVDIKNIPNFIQADAQHLPFRDKSFKKVICYHVIEHVDDPYLLVEELLRVVKDTLEIRCPHRFSCDSKMPYHKHYFNRKWLARVFRDYIIEVDMTYWFPFTFLGLLRLPHEIRLEVILKGATRAKRARNTKFLAPARAGEDGEFI